MDIVCLGAANLDIFASPVDRSVFQVQKQHIEEIGLVPGGDAVNQALTLSKFGVHAGLAACVGADEIGEMLLRTLRSRGVETACTEILPGEPTTVAIVLVGKDGERNIVAKAGAHTKLCRESALRTLTSSVRALSIGSFFSCPDLEDDGMEVLLRTAQEKGILTFADMSSDKRGLGFSGIARFLPYLDYFLPSLYDAEYLTGKREKSEIAEVFLQAGVRHVLIKCGAEGCYYQDAVQRGGISAVPVSPVDTTGAGDTFVATFLYRTLSGDPLPEAAAFACAAATLHTQTFGASDSPLSEEAVQAFRRAHLEKGKTR